MRELVEFVARELVDHPEEVQVTQTRGNQVTVIQLAVAPDDKGWVIGKRGRVANAMRSLLRVAAMSKGRRRAVLEIL
ncbi:MAG: KH domain-containing protein [Chloroflexi bacterium]|jgi:predicted RNA-binding protein YlqC (UPF0109 family)|nr:KH domain-containing protein [Chloroflexota bacterium]